MSGTTPTTASRGGILDRVLDGMAAATRFLVLPLSLLLFLQWPLREWLHAGSREANDLAQILFALYVSVAVTYASRRRAHLATDVLARRYSVGARARLAQLAGLCAVLPWSLFVIHVSWEGVLRSIGQLESFPETYNPGYFLLRATVLLLAVLVALQVAAELLRARWRS